jgi:hypothetical protein
LLFGGVAAAVTSEPKQGGSTVTLAKARTMLTKAMPVRVEKLPTRLAKDTPEEKLARWQQNWEPAYIYYVGCKDWYFGFNILQIASDAAAYGGAKVVAQIMDWILDYTQLGAVSDWLNIKVHFRLQKYNVSTRDADGAWGITETNRKRIADWTPRRGGGSDVPPVPIAESPDAGWARCWVAKERGGVYAGEDDGISTVMMENTGGGTQEHTGRSEPWVWTWLIATAQLRTLLRHDKINLSTIAKQGCGSSRWWFTFSRYVKDIYK